MMPVQLADVAAAREFSATIAHQVPDGAEVLLAHRLIERRNFALALIPQLGQGQRALDELLGLFFSVRRHRGEILADADLSVLDEGISSALAGAGASEVFGAIASCGFGDLGLLRDLASEILHIVNPVAHPLWRRWVLDADQETGALALIVEDPTELYGVDDAMTYSRVCFATEYLRETLSASSVLRGPDSDPFTFDVFLAGVYGVYSSTVIKMRMTKEFNSLLPDLGEFMARILGVKGERDASRR